MEFNAEKCNYLRISKRGQSDIGNLYTMLDRPLTKVSEERDLSICVSANLKSSSQCSQAAIGLIGF